MKHPDCTEAPENCRIQMASAMTTVLHFAAVFDGNGNPVPVSNDPNTFTQHYQCATCNRRWYTATRGGKTEVRTA
jgi:hypothetical protein